MSDSPDLSVLSDLLQDLSVQFRRVSINRQDGEPRASREEGTGPECVRTHGAASSTRNPATPSGEGASPNSGVVSPGPPNDVRTEPGELQQVLLTIEQLFVDLRLVWSLLYPDE